jgi:hypothetical protein
MVGRREIGVCNVEMRIGSNVCLCWLEGVEEAFLTYAVKVNE